MIDILTLCLALNIYFEARGEPIEGQFAVAEVTLRRAAISSKPVCVETFSDSQFSWTLNADTAKIQNKNMWAQAQVVAQIALVEPTHYSKGATPFHSTTIRPRWSKQLCKVVTIGRHVFYKECSHENATR